MRLIGAFVRRPLKVLFTGSRQASSVMGSDVVSYDEVKALVAAGSANRMVDVREYYEIEATGTIGNAIHIPRKQLHAKCMG